MIETPFLHSTGLYCMVDTSSNVIIKDWLTCCRPIAVGTVTDDGLLAFRRSQ